MHRDILGWLFIDVQKSKIQSYVNFSLRLECFLSAIVFHVAHDCSFEDDIAFDDASIY